MRILRVITKEVSKALLSPAECKVLEPYTINKYITTLATHGANKNDELLIDAIKNNRFDVLAICLKREEYFYIDILAAEFGGLSILMWLVENGCPVTSLDSRYVARGNNLKGLQWLHKKGARFDDDTMEQAATTGNISMLRWLWKKHVTIPRYACVRAAQCGHLPALKWLKDHGGDVDTVAIASAAYRGHLDVVKWGINLPRIDHHEVFRDAARGGHTHIIKWGMDKRFHMRGLCEAAAMRGQLGTLKWLHENKQPLSEKVYEGAAYARNIKMLEWLREQDCPWNAKTCAAVVDGFGHWKYDDSPIDVFRWLRDHGCPWDIETCDNARQFACAEVSRWLIANECPCGGTLH